MLGPLMLMAMHTRQRQRAFTLVELMLVIGLVGALIALAAPSFKRMIDLNRLRGINATLITDLQYARSEAASRNDYVYVLFDKTGSSLTCYVILQGDPTACNCRNTPGTNVCSTGNNEIRTVQVDRSLSVTVATPSTQTLSYFAFDPATGRMKVVPIDILADPAGPFVIEVANPSIGAFVNAVEVTGRPTVCANSAQITGVTRCP
jgi:prepilin-type N-terminal cleavage/methylation domain-containing protein